MSWRHHRRGVLLAAAVIVAVMVSCAQEADLEDDAGDSAFAAEDTEGPEAFMDHWHAAFGVYVCNEFLPAMPEFESPDGIHTHGDGVIHIHPFSEDAAGRNATLGVFLRDSGIELKDGELVINGERYADGRECDGEPAVIQTAYWEDAERAGDPEIVTEDVDGLRLRRDGEAFTIALVPENVEIPPPPTAGQLAELGTVDQGGPGASGTTGASGPASTVYGDPELAAEVLGRTPPDPAPPPSGTPVDALEVETLIEGQGEGARVGDQVTVHYVGVLADDTVFDESWGRGQPFPVTLGQGTVIAGWEAGLIGAKTGERRRLVMGADNAYGSEGTGSVIPPDAPLAFEVDIIDITR